MYNSMPNELRMLTKHLKHPVKLRWHWRQLIKPSNQSSPWKINVEPENGGLEDDFPFNWVILRPLLIFRGVYGFPELYVTHFNQIFNCHIYQLTQLMYENVRHMTHLSMSRLELWDKKCGIS